MTLLLKVELGDSLPCFVLQFRAPQFSNSIKLFFEKIKSKCKIFYYLRNSKVTILIVICCASQIIFASNDGSLFAIDGLQFWTICDSVAQTATIRAAPFAVGLQKLFFFRLKIGKKFWNILTGFNEQMFEIEQNCVFDRFVDQGRCVALLVATSGTTNSEKNKNGLD